ncbi:Methyltransferase domain-containing protein [Paenibacillus algorifonticola]|uniref:Methyltransferase domain-containing protein n=2 Tax=Paenibacillus algorifonticola TaxID=684063 RepID=A0A1I2IBF8_9BACL|nr:Methyltransferase domain-containing protein [Paenibacillus algorifonticola]
MAMKTTLTTSPIQHQVSRHTSPLGVMLLRFIYLMYYALLYPPYYFWNKRDFKTQTKKNPFYVSKLVRLVEKHPRLYELSMFVLNFPRPTAVYHFLPELQGRVLQVGCGTGLLNKHAKGWRHVEFFNLDINEKHLQFGMKKGRLHNCIHSGIYQVEKEDECFDKIVFARCFHHIRHHKKAFKECARLLNKGGELWILDPVILEEQGSGKQMSAGYMANSSIDGVIWRFTKKAFIEHVLASLPGELELISITENRQPHLTNYNLKYPQTDILAVIRKRSEGENK